MSDKLNEQADKMREMAQTTLDKAKDAVSKYMARIPEDARQSRLQRAGLVLECQGDE